MRIINAGLGRTGTTSLKAALETLGYTPVYHTTDLLTSAKDINVWEEAMKGEAVDWRAFFAGYQVADWPAGLFYRDIIRAHPEAKVMLSVRDPEGWFESISGTLKQLRSLHLPIPQVRRAKGFLEAALDSFFEGKVEDKAYMMTFFERHMEAVKAYVGAEKVLVYDVREGWEPLCAFLQVDVPKQSFPRLNQREGFRELAAKLFSRSGVSATSVEHS